MNITNQTLNFSSILIKRQFGRVNIIVLYPVKKTNSRQLAGGSWQEAGGSWQEAVGSRLNIAVAFKQLKQLAVRSSK